ncbi:hypothetical protein B0J17DRAFT_717925 [Rhizoctonia solani]|nr:hypothetical protein B0J17DRAFT_717925 [Rhizoctonia solani]
MQSNYGTPSRPSLIKWQCWISLLQSLASIVAIVFWVLFAVVPKLSKTLSIVWWVAGLVSIPKNFGQYGSFMDTCLSQRYLHTYNGPQADEHISGMYRLSGDAKLHV